MEKALGFFLESASPGAELDFAGDLINRVVDGVNGPITALHVCRGNWSQKENVLLAGSYESLVPYFARMKVKQFVLEYATPRAGSVQALRGLPDGTLIGFGAVNPRTEEVEHRDEIAGHVEGLVGVVSPDRLHLNPDCGFGTFADRPVATTASAFQKLFGLSQTAVLLPREYE